MTRSLNTRVQCAGLVVAGLALLAVAPGAAAGQNGAGGQTGGRPDLIGNVAPQLTLESPDTLTVSAGEPVSLRAMAADDGKPSRRAFSAFRAWFAEFDAAEWDVQFEQDASTGRLDAFASEALDDLRQGRATER